MYERNEPVTEEAKQEGSEPEEKTVEWRSFLESIPPNSPHRIADLQKDDYALQIPNLMLYCTSDICNGERVFTSSSVHGQVSDSSWTEKFLHYVCRNCHKSRKTYAILFIGDKAGPGGQAIKLGEWPPFGPHTPARVLRLIQPDKDTYLKARQAENQGLGIGAFSYYRRVVENQKNRLIDNIIQVAERLKAPQGTLDTLAAAKKETRFSAAVELVKDALPQTLLINGHNPMTLLHTALSQGLHAQTDQECLELAATIRVVLTDLAERLSQALKDHAEIQGAINRLMKPRGEPSKAVDKPSADAGT
jgi:hypothetical protein